METVLCVLAGGKSSRFKEDKRWAIVNGKPLIQIVIEKLEQFSDNIVISTRNSETVPIENVKIVEDSKVFGGPLCGIFEIMKRIKSDRFVFFAADMPFITEEMVRALIDDKGKEITVFQCKGKVYPLPIAIDKSVLDLKSDCANRSLMSILDNVDYNVINIDSKECVELFNINTQDDLLKAAEYLLKPNKNANP